MRILHPEAFTTRPAAVLFDLDHTLYEYDPPHAEGMRAVREKLATSLDVTAPAFDAAFATARNAVKKRLGHTASSHSRLLYFAATVEALGYGPQPLLALDLEQTYWRTFLGTARLAAGAEDVLIELRALNIPLGLVTDLTMQIQFRKLVYFGLDRTFDAVVTSEEAGVEKVGLTPFAILMNKLRLPDGAPVWMVGDSRADIEGSRTALKATTIQKLWGLGAAQAHPDADALVHDFAGLLGLIRTRLAGPGAASA